MTDNTNLIEILDYIDPSLLDYQSWLSVGMALKHEGLGCSVWEEWSQKDIGRYHQGECEKKWQSFNGNALPVTGGTIIQFAKDQGWRPERESHELDWDSEIGRTSDDLIVVNSDWVEEREIEPPEKWDPAGQIIKYLETIFEAGENVGYVTKSWEKDGKFLPANKGYYDRTAGQLIEELSKCKGDIGSVLGDYNEEAGAWIRFNPLDGKDVKNENVTEYRYALVESDSTDVARQNAIIRELELPVACLVFSGGKSIHAIVRVDAANYDEYRRRVDYLYDICHKNGLEIDKQNRNPSRLSRMPGVIRGNQKQFIIDTNIGKESWNEWKDWIESVNDDLPEPENMESAWNNLPDLSAPLIEGVLRKGHKMLLAGPSKAGKSYALIELCCAIAEGRSWFGFQCAKGRVMYVNLELDRASCLHRFKDVYTALNWNPLNLKNIDIWNLRGKSVPMDKLAPKLIRRALKKDYIAIIIDPIYKVITGDENSADQMAHFCNQFDKVCTELGCAVIYCHHHSKGTQGQKRSMDRASGSGVFARDPDALLDLLELPTNENLIKQEQNKAACGVIIKYLNKYSDNWDDHISQDDMCSEKCLKDACKRLFSAEIYDKMVKDVSDIKEVVKSRTAWRIEGTLREFPKFEPLNLWFDYPIHRIDHSGALKDIKAEYEVPAWQKAIESRKSKSTKKEERITSLENAYEACSIDDEVTIKAMSEYLGITEKAVRTRVKEHGKFWIEDGKIGKKA